MKSLLDQYEIHAIRFPNRMAVSPMCQYSSEEGRATEFHLAHLGRFALGGFGLVMVEATAVLPEGRTTHRDMGIWSEDHVPGLSRVAALIRSQGAVAGLQIAHSGPKGSRQLPWSGNKPLANHDPVPSEPAWTTAGPTAAPIRDGWPRPEELDLAGIGRVREAFKSAAERADRCGFEVLELHFGHGYLLSSFLAAALNRRDDEYGGSRENRMRLALEICGEVREIWPADKPLFVRISAVDGDVRGRGIEDSVVLAKALGGVGADLIDCSSGGVGDRYEAPLGYGYQVPYAAQIRAEAEIPTMAVGLIVDPRQADEVVRSGSADLVAIGRGALENPNWALTAYSALGDGSSPFHAWPPQSGWWLADRAAELRGVEEAPPEGTG